MNFNLCLITSMFSFSFPTFLNCCVTTLLLAYIGCLPDRNHRSPMSRSCLIYQTCRHSTFAHDSDICCQNRSHNIWSPNRNLFISHPQQQPWLMTFDKFCRPKTDISASTCFSWASQTQVFNWRPVEDLRLTSIRCSDIAVCHDICDKTGKTCNALKKTSAEKNDVHCVQKKNTHSHILLYLHEWCVDLNKNCSEYT